MLISAPAQVSIREVKCLSFKVFVLHNSAVCRDGQIQFLHISIKGEFARCYHAPICCFRGNGNRCRDDLDHKGNHHIRTSVFGVQRLSSSIYLHPDSSPFCYFSRNGSNGSRLACRGNNQSYSKIKPPIFLDLPVDLGIKKERLSIPNAGKIDALCTR